MKPNYLITALFFLCFFSASAQENNTINSQKKEIAFDLLAFHSPILNRNFFGFSMDAKYYVAPKWGTGFNFAAATKRISTDFSLGAAEPDVSFLTIGWLNQYDLIQSERVRVGINLNNGLAIVRLRDRSEVDIFWDEFGYTEVPVSRGTTALYIIEPGITASFRMFSPKDFADIFLTTQAKYRQAIGNPKFGQTDDYTNYFLGVGVSFIGPLD
jgi:hypothetical protein